MPSFFFFYILVLEVCQLQVYNRKQEPALDPDSTELAPTVMGEGHPLPPHGPPSYLFPQRG